MTLLPLSGRLVVSMGPGSRRSDTGSAPRLIVSGRALGAAMNAIARDSHYRMLVRDAARNDNEPISMATASSPRNAGAAWAAIVAPGGVESSRVGCS